MYRNRSRAQKTLLLSLATLFVACGKCPEPVNPEPVIITVEKIRPCMGPIPEFPFTAEMFERLPERDAMIALAQTFDIMEAYLRVNHARCRIRVEIEDGR